MAILWVVAFALCIPLSAQSSGGRPALSTNRPNATESPDPVPQGYIHFELGWQLSGHKRGDVQLRIYDFPATVVRFGLHRRLELSFGWAGAVWEELEVGNFVADTHGVRDGQAAAKVRLWSEKGILPRASLRGGLSLPFGDDSFSSQRADPFLFFLATHSLGERVSLNYNLGPSWSTGAESGSDRDTLSSFNYIFSVDIALQSRLAVSLELFGATALSASGRAQNSIDWSLGYNFRNLVIADFIVGRGLSSTTPDWFIGSGLTFQFPL